MTRKKRLPIDPDQERARETKISERVSTFSSVSISQHLNSPKRPDIWNPPIQRKHHREPPEHHHTNHEDDESPGRKREVVVVELVERKDGSDVDEGGGVEEQIDDVGEVGFFSLFVEESTAKKGD